MALKRNAPGEREFYPTEQFGLAGLQTFDDPEFIDDAAMAWCNNVTIDSGQLHVRKGTNLLYSAPAGETGTPQQLFRFKDRNGIEYLLAKYSDNWYALSTEYPTWIIIASQIAGNSAVTGATWHDVFYSHDLFVGANDAANSVFGDFAFFAPNDYSIPNQDADNILVWPPGITELATAANIGDTFLNVVDAGALNVVNSYGQVMIGNTPIAISSTNSLMLNATVTEGSAIMTGIASTTVIETGTLISGYGVPANTRVVTILSSTSIEMSQEATDDSTTSFTATADMLLSNPNYLFNINNVGGTIIGGLTVSGTDITSGTTVTSVSVSPGATALGSGELADSSNEITNYVASNGTVVVGMTVTGTDIPSGTVVVAVAGTTIQISQEATADVTSESLSFTAYTTTVGLSQPVTGNQTQETVTFAQTDVYTYTFTQQGGVVLYNPLTAAYPAGTLVANTLTVAPLPYEGNAVLSWLNQFIIATVASPDSLSKQGIAFSSPGNPFNFDYNATSNPLAGVASGKGERIVDMQAFGQFFLANSEDDLQIAQSLVNSTALSYGLYLTPYLAGNGMGADSAASCLNYNNEYYYATTNNGIIALAPAFTGTSSSAGLSVLTDKIHNLFLQFTFLGVAAFNRKIWWLVSIPATPEKPIQYYYLVYDLIRTGFTLIQHLSVSLVTFNETLCLLGTDGNVYQAEYDSYEDYIGGKSVGYLAEAVTKRWNYNEPILPKNSQYCMVQGQLLTGTTLNVDVLYNEGGSLGKQSYKIIGSNQNPYFILPNWEAMGTNPLGTLTLAGGNVSLGNFRVYLELNQGYQAHNFQLRFWSNEPGDYWSIATVGPDVEITNVPTELVISPS